MVLALAQNMKNTLQLSILLVYVSYFFIQYNQNALQTICPLYLEHVLNFSQEASTWYFHVFSMLANLLSISGILGDSSLGKYRTTVYFLMLLLAACFTITVGATPLFDPASRWLLTCVGAVAVCVGWGSVCVMYPFGGEQLPSSKHHSLSHYFSVVYYISNVACLLANVLTPILRHNYQCFGRDSCFPLAFFVLDVMTLVSLAVFVAGRSVYVCKPSESNIVKDVIECSCYALSKKMCSKEKKKHWLDHAEDKYSKTLISDTKAAFGALWWLLPAPVFWALDAQTGSTWVFQAVHMDGSLGWFNIKPDQMGMVDPLMTLAMVPMFELMIYPRLARWGLLQKPLDRLAFAGLLTAASFLLAALVELQIRASFPRLPGDGTAQLRVFNGLNCDVTLTSSWAPPGDVIPPLEALQVLDVAQEGAASHPVTFTTGKDCYLGGNRTFHGSVTLQERQSSSLFLHSRNHTLVVSQLPGYDMIDKTAVEDPKLRVVYNLHPFVREVTLSNGQYSKTYHLNDDSFSTSLDSILQTGELSAKLGNASVFADVHLGSGGIYTLIVNSHNNTSIGRLIAVTPPNTVHMLWQLPQFVTITAAETMFTITGNTLSYTEAPESMRSLISVAWTMTTAVGNLIVMIVISSQLVQNQVIAFFFYSGMMVVASVSFYYVSARYEYLSENV